MATNSKQVKPLDIPFKEFTPGQVIQSVQFNDDMLDIEDKVNELVNEHNIVSDEIDSHTSNLDNPHQVDAHQTGTYYASEIDEFFQDVKSGNLNDNAITNRVLDDDCVTGRNIEDNTITVSKVDSMLGSQLDISQNIEIATRYTKEETDNLIQDKVGNGTYSKEELDVKFEEVQAGVIVDSIIGIEKLKEDVGTKLNIGSNINILNKYTKDEVDYLIRCNALPRDWGSILGDDEVEPFFDTKNGIFPVADFMIADKFVTSNDNILDFEIREVVDSRGEYETLNDRLNVYDTIKPEINEELEVISNKINDNQNINNEEHNTINSKVLDNKNSISSLNTKVSNLENTTSTQGNKISSLERRSDTLESRASALESADRGINVKISNVENRLGNIDTLNNTQTSKINALENRANTTDSNISNINSNINTVKTDLNNVKSDLNTVKEDLSNVGQIVNENIEPIRTELSQVVSKNNEQDNRLNSLENDLNGLPDVISNHNDMLEKHKSEINNIKYVNKRQDVMIGGLFNENADGRLNIDGEGNDVKLEGSKDGLVEVNKVVGNTIVNVCDQKEPVAITKSYIVETGNHVALQGEYDGKARPVPTGNTLVNLVANTNYPYDLQTDNGIQNMFKPILNYNLDSTKTYSLVLKLSNTSNPDNSVISVALEDSNSSTINKFVPISDGIHFLTITGVKQFYNMRIGQGSINNGARGTLDYVILLEGDYTNKPIPDYFEGMKSSFEDKVVTQETVDSGKELAENLGKYRVDYKVTGKNKFDGRFELGSYRTIDGIKLDSTDTIRNVNLIKVKPNTKYVFSNSSSGGISLRLYDKDKEYLTFITVNTMTLNNNVLTTPSNCHYINFTILNTDTSQTVQIEEGSTATDYEPYKDFTKTYYLNSPLLEGDTIEESNGNVYHVHRYGKVVLDGSKDETYQQWGSSDNYCNFVTNKLDSTAKFTTDVFCDKLPERGNTLRGTNESVNLGDGNSAFEISIAKSKLATADVVGFRTWLKANPLTVIYQLASPTYELISQSDTILTDSYVAGHLDFDTTVLVERVEFRQTPSIPLKYAYVSTSYIIQFESDNVGRLYNANIGGTNVAYAVSKGLNKVNLTTKDTLSHNYLVFNGIGFNMSNIVVTEATDKDFGYFEGMKSSFEDKVTEDGKYAVEAKVVGKNLFDGEWERGSINLTTGIPYDNNLRVRSKNFNVITPGSYIQISGEITKNNSNAIVLFDDNFNFLCRINIGSLATEKLPYKAKYFKIVMFEENNNEIPLNCKVQIEEGTQATSYEPYKEHVQTLYLDEPLYKDNELCVHDGKLGYWKNRDSVVLDGSEDESWTKFEADTVNNRFHIFISNSNQLYSICDKLKSISIDNLSENTNYIVRYNDSGLRVGNITGVTTLNEFKLWLQSNPLTVVYKLTEPVFVPILENTPQWVLESFNDCSIHFNSNIPIISSNLSYTGNVPSVYSMQRTNQIQDDLIDVSLMATDEMFMMLEPLLSAIPQVINEKGCSKMVDMYVAMVMRGLKTIEEVPVRYREEVKKVLDKLEK